MTIEEVIGKKGCLYYKSVGVSMRPLIREGLDLVYIEKCLDSRLKKYDVVLFRRSSDLMHVEYVLHRILKVNPDGTYWIVGDNCTSGEMVRRENILGVLTAIKRKNKAVKMCTSIWCKLYTYLWCAPWPIRFFILRCRNHALIIAKKIFGVLKPK